MTPLMQQYFAIKAKYKDAVLLFRVGGFYESFNEDAQIISAVLGNTLQLTACDSEVEALASIPHYTLDTALHKLVKAGYRVAVCEQLEAPKAGPMRRGVTDVLEAKEEH